MTLETTRWDGSEHMDNPESILLHLEDARQDGDPALMALVLGDVAKALGMSMISREVGIDRATLYKAIVSDGRRESEALANALASLEEKLRSNPATFSEAAE